MSMLDRLIDRLADRLIDRLEARRPKVHIKMSSSPAWRLIAQDAEQATASGPGRIAVNPNA